MKITIDFDKNNFDEAIEAFNVLQSILQHIEKHQGRHSVPKDWLHPTQEELLKLANKEDLSRCTLREIGRKIGLDHPQIIKYHLSQLQKKKLIIFRK